jgi:hypothetical protein
MRPWERSAGKYGEWGEGEPLVLVLVLIRKEACSDVELCIGGEVE